MGLFLAALKFFYRVLRDEDVYAHENPLVDQFSVTLAALERIGVNEDVLAPRMPDWQSRGLKQEASTFSKGSHGRRIKFLRFSASTAKLLRRYFDGERRKCDSAHFTLDQYLRNARQGAGQLWAVPLFLSSQRTPLQANHFRDHFWRPACQAAGIDVDVHQARHWYVTMSIRHIHETAATDAEIRRRSRELIAYMNWRRGWGDDARLRPLF